MKNVFLLLPLLFFWLACGEITEEEPTRIVITGTASEDLEINLHGQTKTAEAMTDSAGFFAFEFEADEPAYYKMRGSRQSIDLFLVPGDSIHISFEAESWAENTQFSADRALENEYLHRKVNVLNESHWNNYRKLFNFEKDSFLYALESGTQSLNELLSELEENPEANERFVELEKAHAPHHVAILNYYYPMYYAHFQELDRDEVDYPIEDDLVLKEAVDRPDLLPLPIFRESLERKMDMVFRDHLPEGIYEKEQGVVLTTQYELIDSFFANEKIREFLKFQFLNERLSYSGPGAIDPLYEDFIQHSSHPTYVNILKETMGEWSELMPGMEVPDFEFEKINEESVNLSDLKGKLVYIDVWATWCGPCLAEHPHWEELVAEYKDEEVHFLAISLDSEREPWVKMVEEKELSGIHWYAGGGWNADFTTHFRVLGIPRFILLDREGKILEVSAARPSGNIRLTLDKYLATFAEVQ